MVDQLSRKTVSSKAYDLDTAGRSTQLNKIYVGFVKGVNDSQYMGRLKVFIPELGGDPNDVNSYYTVTYASPFAGATSVYDNTNGPAYQDSQRSYGFWFVPPNLENEVVCAFINGDPSRGIWFGCLYQQFMDHMVPGIPGDPASNGIPVGEYNKLNTGINVSNPTRPIYAPLADQLAIEGLDKDAARGITTSGARREDPPNSVYGILSPGGQQFVMDDAPGAKFIRLRTQLGTQVLIDDSEGFVYINSRDGASWVELGTNGEINIYGLGDISIRSQGTLNLRADNDIRMEAGRSVFIKARGETGNNVTGTPSAANPGSGQILKATTTNTAQTPTITPDMTSATIIVATNAITGTFVPGMSITGIPFDNPQTSTPPQPPNTVNSGNTSSGSATPMPGSGNPVVTVGDQSALAVGQSLGQSRAGVYADGNVATTANQLLQNIQTNPATQNAAHAVVSMTGITGDSGAGVAGQLTADLQNIRSNLNASGYTWLLPSDDAARAAVYGVATANGDAVIPHDFGQTPGQPPNTSAIANNINQNIGATPAPVIVPNTTSTAGTQAPPVPAVTVATVGNDGNLTMINVTFSTGNTANASNVNVITGTLQNETTNNNVTVTNNNVSDSGMVMINAYKDMHLTTGRDMYQHSDGLTSRSATKNLFDTAGGSWDQSAGGYLTVESNGLLSLGSSNNIAMGAVRIDLNGPTPSAAKSAPPALTPIDTQLKDNQVLGPAQFRFTLLNTIVSVLPTHEPYDGHAATTQGLNGHVESGPAIDGSNGEPLKDGAVTSGQAKPLDIQGSPAAGGQPGKYSGQTYDSKGQPQYKFDSATTALSPIGSFHISQAGAEFIGQKEGKKSTVYPDAVKLPTIGIGHLLLPDENAGNYVTINGVKRPLTSPLSTQEIYDLFKQDIVKYENIVKKEVTVNVTQTQFDMLCSLCYNCGNVKRVAAVLNTGNYNCSEPWMSYSYARGGVFLQSLNNRRREEYTNFSTGNPIQSPSS